jgi:hypothetical protein
MDTEIKTKTKTGPKDLKQKNSPPRRSLREILQQGAGSSGALLRGPAATSKPVEISAKDRDEPVGRNLSEVKSETTLLGVSSTDIPLQGTSTSSIPTAGEGLGHIVSGVGELHLVKKALSGCSRWKLKRQELRQAKQELRAFSYRIPGNSISYAEQKTLPRSPDGISGSLWVTPTIWPKIHFIQHYRRDWKEHEIISSDWKIYRAQYWQASN